MSKKNSKAPRRALVENGMIRCPKCGGLLGKVYYGGAARNIELYCGKKHCHFPVLVEVGNGCAVSGSVLGADAGVCQGAGGNGADAVGGTLCYVGMGSAETGHNYSV